jgi:hypothetical protein
MAETEMKQSTEPKLPINNVFLNSLLHTPRIYVEMLTIAANWKDFTQCLYFKDVSCIRAAYRYCSGSGAGNPFY